MFLYINTTWTHSTPLSDSFLAALSLSRVFMARMERSGGDADTLRLVVVGVWLLQGKNI